MKTSFVVRTTPQFDRLLNKLTKLHPDLADRFAEAIEKQFAIVAGNIVFAGDIEHFFLTKALEDLVQRVKFGGPGKVSEVARVENRESVGCIV